ncbi:hypothetical protein CG723_41455 [Streptomyces sp. CB01635]|uniref:hypothetical protein n=1 Tax=unclassified Streptomyces TaxID=2593676 RepID=UPI000C27B535|nr:hypothetical protein [Streptomyces sp. CB01635]PJN06065.1 hypothetical protein CG723_41455 [Streptomyces sp. CB01635]
MDVTEMLQVLGLDPAQLSPAPSSTARAANGFARIGRTPQPCVSCGRPATTTSVADIPGFGPRWIDKCTPHMIAVTKRGSTAAPEVEAMAALRDVVRQAGVDAVLLSAPLT